MSKEFKNISDQVNYLVNNKNIETSSLNISFFEERSYISLINPYKEFICINKDPISRVHLYKSNTSFNDFKLLIAADDYISSKLGYYINLFEKRLKTYIANVLSNKMKFQSNNCNDYTEFKKLLLLFPTHKNLNDLTTPLNPCHFKAYDLLHIDEMYDTNGTTLITPDKNIVDNRWKVITTLIELGEAKKKNYSLLIEHYKINHVPLPIWTVIHGLNLGELLTIFNMFEKNDRIALCEVLLSRRLRSRDINEISKRIEIMREIRNIINHYEPLFPYINMKLKENKDRQIISMIRFLINNYNTSKLRNINITSTVVFDNWVDTSQFNKKRNELILEILNII